MKHRLFLAVEIPQQAAAPVAALQSRLDSLGLPIRWEPAEKLHLTLNFIGKVDDEKQNQIVRMVTSVVGSHQSFSLSPFFLETMYRKHEGSYVYLGVTGDIQQLNGLQSDLAGAISGMNIAQPDKFLPHITIGKLKKMDPGMTKEVLQKIRDQEFDPLPAFVVDKVFLYESLLSRSGSHYRKVGRYMLN